MHVRVDPDAIVEGTTDERGRLYLGPEYASEDVQVAIVGPETVIESGD